jgi:excinuclease UvrABC nuclease subunit
MEDAAGTILYVGKAMNLRRRLAAYAGRAPSLHRRLEGLMARAARVTVRETPSDLEATLLESRLLRQHAPPFNVAQRVHQGATFVRISLTDDPPRVHVVLTSGADGASYVGPLRSARQAQQALAVARLAFPAAFGRKPPDPAARRSAVLGVASLLGGQKEAALAALRANMRDAAALGAQEAIDRARDALRRVRDLTIEPSLLVGMAGSGRLLIVEQLADGRQRGHVIEHGTRLGSVDVDVSTRLDDPEVIRRLADAASRDAGAQEADPDERTIISRWLAMSKSVVGVFRVQT